MRDPGSWAPGEARRSREFLELEAFARRAARSHAPSAGPGWRPRLTRLRPGELGRLRDVCRDAGIALIDTVDRQLMELAAVRLPGAPAERRQAWARDRLAEAEDPASYGVWVHLPWASRIVHLLGPDEYHEVVTNRNRDKITLEEQARLRTKRIGVIGLSVGGEAAVTLAQEHLCGEMVLADFDPLDLSNLNRLGAGIDELGANKARVVARRIGRIDPYLDLTLYEDGVTGGNLDDVLSGLDLLLEECDDLPMKYRIRREARRRNIDVVYAGDERGFLSVEPYGQRPDLAPFHGRVGEPPPPRGGFPTELSFFRALSEWLGGWEAISERSRRSLRQVGETLCGYPQLASEARFAAGQVGHVARRLLLGERLAPFLGHVDLADLLPSASEKEP